MFRCPVLNREFETFQGLLKARGLELEKYKRALTNIKNGDYEKMFKSFPDENDHFIGSTFLEMYAAKVLGNESNRPE